MKYLELAITALQYMSVIALVLVITRMNERMERMRADLDKYAGSKDRDKVAA